MNWHTMRRFVVVTAAAAQVLTVLINIAVVSASPLLRAPDQSNWFPSVNLPQQPSSYFGSSNWPSFTWPTNTQTTAVAASLPPPYKVPIDFDSAFAQARTPIFSPVPPNITEEMLYGDLMRSPELKRLLELPEVEPPMTTSFVQQQKKEVVVLPTIVENVQRNTVYQHTFPSTNVSITMNEPPPTSQQNSLFGTRINSSTLSSSTYVLPPDQTLQLVLNLVKTGKPFYFTGNKPTQIITTKTGALKISGFGNDVPFLVDKNTSPIFIFAGPTTIDRMDIYGTP